MLSVEQINLDFENNFYEKDGKYSIDKNCPSCGKIINLTIREDQKLYLLKRNYRKAILGNTICRTCRSKGDKNPFYGKSHSNKTKEQVSKSRTGKGTGLNNAMANPEHRKKATTNLKKKWDSGEMEDVREKMRNVGIRNQAEGKIKSLYKSKLEQELYNRLKLIFTDASQHKTIESKHFDIYIPSKNLLIEFNGDYWHCNPAKYEENYFNKKKSKYAHELWTYDTAKLNIGKEYGFAVMVVWESDYKNNIELIIEQIKNF